TEPRSNMPSNLTSEPPTTRLYEALLACLLLAKSKSAKQISIHSDSQLIVNQITADFAARDASMTAYLATTHRLLEAFQAYEIRQIPGQKTV
ncbi:PREDICTED: RVT_3 domain-containing, partial [Prunus dulcis]